MLAKALGGYDRGTLVMLDMRKAVLTSYTNSKVSVPSLGISLLATKPPS